MFIELKSGAMLNLLWLSDCFQGKHDKNIVIFYMVNGSKVIEEYTSESDAKERVDQVQEIMAKAGFGGGSLNTQIVDELPEEGEENVVYLVPTEDEQDMFAEWVYIEGQWNPWGVKRIDLDTLKEQIESEVLTIDNTTPYTPTGRYNPATKDYVDNHGVTFKPFDSSFVTNGTTQQFFNSIRTFNPAQGMTYLGQVRFTDMPTGLVQAEVEVYVYPNNVYYCIMRSANLSPYVWECNSYEYRGWEPSSKVATDYADNNFLKKNNTTAFIPTGDYNPATKKYVDDSIQNAITQVLTASY